LKKKSTFGKHSPKKELFHGPQSICIFQVEIKFSINSLNLIIVLHPILGILAIRVGHSRNNVSAPQLLLGLVLISRTPSSSTILHYTFISSLMIGKVHKSRDIPKTRGWIQQLSPCPPPLIFWALIWECPPP
jgi:hypothetical protein